MFQRFNYNCSICKKKFPNPDTPVYYPHAVCEDCDKRAILNDGSPASTWFKKKKENMREKPPFTYKDDMLSSDTGPNPVFIDRLKCWRRYRLGTWITMKDVFNSHSLEEFETNNFS
ncbi:MAG: hypothetical protein KAI43_12070 [Candidatus Aureabacteria bacterium]|nr:hypothetical protein [Candidatus Auribacterota bacterium]